LALLDRAIVKLLPAVPKPVVQRISSRYIAGAELGDATRVVRGLNAGGKMATVDVLGEEVLDAEASRRFVDAYEDVLAEIERTGLESTVSVKPTALGLKLDLDLCRENLTAVVDDAATRGNFVRIDMEDSTTTTDTLRLYRELRESGRDNVGFVLQAYMRRTVADVRALADLTPNVRLCKGIYVEPPEIAFTDFDAVRANFVKALDELFACGAHVGIATHDEWLIQRGLERVDGKAREDYEFQMLLGVREERADELVGAGHRRRVYVPFGREWYGYSLRRLQENPKVAGYIAGDTLARLLGR
jgi:proline dehydrogenase